jgi:autotransporter passenger strand-loop-strand repeat protein
VQVVSSGGLASGAWVSAGAFESVQAGGAVEDVTLGGGTAVISGSTSRTVIGSGGTEVVASGGTTNETMVGFGGFQVVSGGGVASATIVSSGGTQYTMGTNAGTTVHSGGYSLVLSGGAISGATIDGGLLELQGGATTGSGLFDFASEGGTLRLDESTGFTGMIGGFTYYDQIDLADLFYGSSTTFAYSGDAQGGTLTVTDGVHTAALALLGQYAAADFTLATDQHGGTIVSQSPAQALLDQQPAGQTQSSLSLSTS